MATESSEQYDTSSQIVWTGPRVVIDPVIVTDLETEYCNVANDFLAFTEKAGDKFTRDTNRIRRLILVNGKYRLISKQSRAHVRELKAAVKSLKAQNEILLEQITAHTETVLHDTSTIANLESEIRGLKHTNEVRSAVIDQQAARIKSLEAQLASLAPAIKHSAADNLG